MGVQESFGMYENATNKRINGELLTMPIMKNLVALLIALLGQNAVLARPEGAPVCPGGEAAPGLPASPHVVSVGAKAPLSSFATKTAYLFAQHLQLFAFLFCCFKTLFTEWWNATHSGRRRLYLGP